MQNEGKESNSFPAIMSNGQDFARRVHILMNNVI